MPGGDTRRSTRLARLREWIPPDVDRSALAAVLLLLGYLLFVLVISIGVLDLARSTVPMLYLFGALAGGNVSLITIVVSINQLVLSRELRSPRELRVEIQAAEEYREGVESETERSVVPREPADFILILTDNVQRQVAALRSPWAACGESALRDELARLDEGLTPELDRLSRLLVDRNGGVFPTLSTILDADFAHRINQSRSIRQSYGDQLTDEAHDHLSKLERELKQLDIARQYFKTIFIERELADVSKLVMYSGLVAIVVALLALLFVGYAERGISPRARLGLLPLAIVINLAPLVLLVTHILRIATVARRTVAITPFVASEE